MNNYLYARINLMLPSEAIPLLNSHIAAHPADDRALTLRGIKLWALGKRAEAIKDYNTAIALNPESDARQALAMANDILAFYNKDLLNP